MSELEQLDRTVTPDDGNTDELGAPTNAGGKKSASFSRVGKLLRSRTTDLIAIALVVVILLSVGREFAAWWRVDPMDAQNPLGADREQYAATAEWGVNGEPVDMRFGNVRYQLSRRVFAGDVKQAEAALLSDCREFAVQTMTIDFAPDEQEQRLLEFVPNAEAVAVDEKGEWTVYRTNIPGSLFLAVRHVKSQDESEPVSTPRVAAWGMMMPQFEENWILYTFHAGEGPGGYNDTLPEIELPPAGTTVMSMQSPLAGRVVTFKTTSDEGAVRAHFDGWFKEHSGRRSGDWRETGGRSFGNFVIETDASSVQVSIVLYRENTGVLSGVINSVSQPAVPTAVNSK